MKVLFDVNISRRIRPFLTPHVIHTAQEMQWGTLQNGDLLKAAEDAGFGVMITADQNVVYQQNNSLRKIALIVVDSNDRNLLRDNATTILNALNRCQPGSYERLQLLPPRKLPQ